MNDVIFTNDLRALDVNRRCNYFQVIDVLSMNLPPEKFIPMLVSLVNTIKDYVIKEFAFILQYYKNIVKGQV